MRREQAVDLPSVVRDVLDMVAFPNGVKLVNELTPVPPVLGDSEALSRVILNLLTNAIQAVEGDGSVTLTVTHEGGNVIVSVADTGCGMSHEFIRDDQAWRVGDRTLPGQRDRREPWGGGVGEQPGGRWNDLSGRHP
jgi:signal transduction histidine kinase